MNEAMSGGAVESHGVEVRGIEGTFDLLGGEIKALKTALPNVFSDGEGVAEVRVKIRILFEGFRDIRRQVRMEMMGVPQRSAEESVPLLSLEEAPTPENFADGGEERVVVAQGLLNGVQRRFNLACRSYGRRDGSGASSDTIVQSIENNLQLAEEQLILLRDAVGSVKG